MPISDWADMMPHTVTHAPLASRDAYGAPTYGAGVDYTARVLYKNQRVRAADGAEVVARGSVWFVGTPTVSPEDKITLPDATTPPLLSVEQYADADGAHHTKVYFG
jgi:hypothetical protein